MNKCLIAGSSGLIGSHLANQLAETDLYSEIILAVRRPRPREGALFPVQTNFDSLESSLRDVSAKDIFCCLGTTIRKAGSQEAFRKVDFTYPLELARWGKAAGGSGFFLVSSLGADATSRVFYNRIKGEIEEAIGELNYERFHILRPSLLLGKRDEFRAGELAGKIIMQLLQPLLFGRFRKYRAIHATTVARAMVRLASASNLGHFTHESDHLVNIARRG